MSKTKFTKGEWEVMPLEEGKEYIRVRGTVLGGKYKIADVCDKASHHDGSKWCDHEREESMANAYLIAQSAEMYEFIDTHMCGFPEAEHLLAKARGEQQ